jgi:hypothetical protein
MKKENFSYSFTTAKSAEEVFNILSDVKQWWSGLFEETIEGKSAGAGDEFTFHAGGGAHYSKQKLVERVPGKTLAWQVTDSNLSFVEHTNEWNGTMIRFDLSSDGKNTTVTFTHEGLVPQIACYDNCSSAWNGYMHQLQTALAG